MTVPVDLVIYLRDWSHIGKTDRDHRRAMYRTMYNTLSEYDPRKVKKQMRYRENRVSELRESVNMYKQGLEAEQL